VSLVLVVLSSLAAVAVPVAWWLHSSLLDTDRFLALTEPVRRSPASAEALGSYLTTQVFQALELEDRVTASLDAVDGFLRDLVRRQLDLDPEGRIGRNLPEPPPLTRLADPLIEAARSRVERTITDWVASEEFQRALTAVARTSHGAAVAVLRQDAEALPPTLSLDGGVVVDLRPVAREAIVRVARATADLLGIEPGVLAGDAGVDAVLGVVARRLDIEIPPDLGKIVVLTEAEIEPYQAVMVTVDRLVWLVTAVAIVLAVGAVLTAPDRIVALAWTGIGAVGAALLTIPVVRHLEMRVLAGLAGPSARDVATGVLDGAVSDLRTFLEWVVVTGALVLGTALGLAWRQGRRSAAPAIHEPSPGPPA
jgi:hypothetical protein